MAERIESLITSQQRLSQDVSHELRSPLARMNVALEIAKQRSNGASAAALARIEKESGQLNEMISRLLTLTRLESGAEKFESQDVDLTGLLEHIAADADFEANAKGRSVKIVSMDACRISGSESLIKSAVENVLRNAVKYTAEGTAVEVALRRAGGRAQLTVRDFGGGVPENELDKLFQPFYRVSESRERKTGGIGLGLAIAERAIKAHKGSIAARNSDGGLTVTIELECRTAQAKI